MRSICSPFAAAVCVLTAAAALAADGPRWIDVHVHLIGGAGAKSDFAGAVRAAVSAMDHAGISKAVVMPPPMVAGQRQIFDWPEFRSAIGAYPGRFAFLGGGGSLNAIIQSNARSSSIDDGTRAEFARIAGEIAAAGAAGFGEIALHHISLTDAHPYESVPADHPLLLLLADIAARDDRVIDVHFDAAPRDMPFPPRFQSRLNPPTLAANLAAFERLLDHSKAKIVWAHAGSDPLGNLTPALAREMLQKHPNLYMSLRMPARTGPVADPPGGGPMGGAGPMRGTIGAAGKFGGGPGFPGKEPGGAMPAEGMRGGPMMMPGAGAAGRAPPNLAMDLQGNANPEWVELVRAFPDRFVMGGDQFFANPSLSGAGPGLMFAQMAPLQRQRARQFLQSLPSDVARKVASENAIRLYKLDS